METTVVSVRSYFRGRLLDACYIDRRRRCYRIGSSRRARAPAPEALIGGPEHALVTVDEAGAAALHLTPAMTGAARLPVEGDAEIRCGAMTFRIARASAPPPLPAPARIWNGPIQRSGAGVTLATVVALGVLALVPPDRKALSLDVAGVERRYVAFRISPPEIPAPPGASSSGGGAADARAGERSAVARAPQPPRLPGRGKNSHPELVAIPAPVTLPDLIARTGSAAVRAVFGRDPALGPDADAVLGGVNGHAIAGAWNLGGLGVTGTGVYGSDTGGKMIGTGNPWIGVTRVGHGDPRYDQYPLAPLRPHPMQPIALDPTGHLTSKGSLDREIVRRIIRAHLNEIRYCYEIELVRRPTLAGRVVLQFAIAPGGQVLSSVVQDSMLRLAPLESCMTQAVRRWTFPQPAGGGLTVVSYPFVFAPAGN